MNKSRLEEKIALTQENKEMILEVDVLLLESGIFGFDFKKVKSLNPLRKKDYDSQNYGKNISPYESK